VEIENPGRTVRIDRLEEGIWYWTVESRSSDGLVRVAAPRQLRVLPIPILPAPGNRRPVDGRNIDINELRAGRINFNWSAVQGANAYIFNLYEQTASGRREIISTAPLNRTGWTLDNISVLNRGTYIWQVEAVNTRNGAIEQRGTIVENSFILYIPVPQIRIIDEPEIIYGD